MILITIHDASLYRGNSSSVIKKIGLKNATAAKYDPFFIAQNVMGQNSDLILIGSYKNTDFESYVFVKAPKNKINNRRITKC